MENQNQSETQVIIKTVDPSLQTTPTNSKNKLLFILGGLLYLFLLGGGMYYLLVHKSVDYTKNTSVGSITLTNYKVSNPTIIQETFQVPDLKGKKYNLTQIIISALLFIPEENDYSITSSFDSTSAKTAIDGKEGVAYESAFHLTKGNHNIEIKYVTRECLDAAYLQRTYGAEAKPMSIYFAIRKKSEKQTLKNYTMFDNPLVIKAPSRPFKKTDLYIHCH